jgi:hypothetical protein
MIKNWKLFLENSSDDNEMINYGNNLKNSLKELYRPFFLNEIMLREFELFDVLKSTVEEIYNSLLGGFEDSMTDRFADNPELGETIKTHFRKSLDRAKIVMNEKSIEEGVDFMVDEFVKLMIDLKHSLESEGEEWKQEKDKDYSEMSQREIQKLVDDALDMRDFKQVEFLSQYLKESVSEKLKIQLDRISKEASELFAEYIMKYFSKFQL